ncbi:MAG: transposase [Longimicrobiaceae bacterium]|nr:helix-turn-helix domain-containing protein [Gemmatimonadota bacterium]
MIRSPSVDQRERAVAAAEEDLTRAEVARQFGRGEATLYNWVSARQCQCDLLPHPDILLHLIPGL